MREERGQALVELVAGLPALLALGLVSLQLLVAGYSAVLAGDAAEAGALAVAGGADPRAAVRAALPGWSGSRARVSVNGGEVELHLRPPALVPTAGDVLAFTARAEVPAP